MNAFNLIQFLNVEYVCSFCFKSPYPFIRLMDSGWCPSEFNKRRTRVATVGVFISSNLTFGLKRIKWCRKSK